MLAVSSTHPLRPVVTLWLHALEKARKDKWSDFGVTARECMRFFDGNAETAAQLASSQFGMDVSDQDMPQTKVFLNRVAELVRIFGPVMYSRNPNRQVNTTTPDLPELLMMQAGPNIQPIQHQLMQQKMTDQAIADLMGWYLNYTPHELNLKEEARLNIDEALIKGRGCMWTELYAPPDSDLVMPQTVFDSVDNLLVDPDATSLTDAMWIARKREQPHWVVERKFGLKAESLKGVAKGESFSQQTVVDQSSEGSHYRKMGQTSDLVTYWEIYSKTGAGNRLNGGTDINDMIRSQGSSFAGVLDEFGDYVYLAIVDGLGYPLNLPDELLDLDMEQPQNEELVKQRLRWPIPFWKDGEWPVTELDFHRIPGQQWPQAHMKSGLAELKLMNWIVSFMAGRIKWTSRMLLVYSEHLDEELKEQLEEGADLSMVANKQHLNNKIKDQIEFVQFPPLQKDVWDIFTSVSEMFAKNVGLTELVYGISGRQHRSATESQIKEQQINVQPDDMAERVETQQSRIARKEAQAARWFVGPESFAPVVGEQFAPEQMQVGLRTHLWNQLVYVPLDYTNPDSLEKVVREFDYRIESGSVRKPNRERDQANMDMVMQSLFQPFMQYFMGTGDPTQVNWLMSEWGKTRDLDISGGLFNPPPPPPQQPALPPPQEQPQPQGAA